MLQGSALRLCEGKPRYRPTKGDWPRLSAIVAERRKRHKGKRMMITRALVRQLDTNALALTLVQGVLRCHCNFSVSTCCEWKKTCVDGEQVSGSQGQCCNVFRALKVELVV